MNEPKLNSGWIAAIARGHNAGVCLFKDGEIVFSIEEERLTRQKYDGGPLASMVKILEYTDKLDYLVIDPSMGRMLAFIKDYLLSWFFISFLDKNT